MKKVKPGEVERVLAAVQAGQEQGKAVPDVLKELKITKHRYAYLRSLQRKNGDGKTAPMNRNGEIRRLETENATLKQERDAALAEVIRWQARYGQLAATHLE